MKGFTAAWREQPHGSQVGLVAPTLQSAYTIKNYSQTLALFPIFLIYLFILLCGKYKSSRYIAHLHRKVKSLFLINNRSSNSKFAILSDFDECKTRSNDCQQVRINTRGSFRCACHSAYHSRHQSHGSTQGSG